MKKEFGPLPKKQEIGPFIERLKSDPSSVIRELFSVKVYMNTEIYLHANFLVHRNTKSQRKVMQEAPNQKQEARRKR